MQQTFTTAVSESNVSQYTQVWSPKHLKITGNLAQMWQNSIYSQQETWTLSSWVVLTEDLKGTFLFFKPKKIHLLVQFGTVVTWGEEQTVSFLVPVSACQEQAQDLKLSSMIIKL